MKFLIENIRALKSKARETHAVEYEVTVDAQVVGELTYGPYYFTVWELGVEHGGAKRHLCLRIEEKVPSDKEEEALASKGLHLYHWSQIANEFVPLASLFLRRRLILGRVVRFADKPRMFSLDPVGKGRFVDEAIVRGKTNLEELAQWLPLLEGLDSVRQEPFMLAVKFYHQALQLMEEKPDMAYLNLVSAVESLCQDFDIGQVKLADIDESLANLVKFISDSKLRDQVEQAIVKRERFAQRKFVRFIEKNTEQSFWDDQTRPTRGRIDSSDLRELLTRIYRQRSGTLHRGQPFPPYIFLSPIIDGEEIPFAINAFMDGGRKWEPKDYIPYPHFFERLVNHVLKNYLKTHQVAGGNAEGQREEAL